VIWIRIGCAFFGSLDQDPDPAPHFFGCQDPDPDLYFDPDTKGLFLFFHVIKHKFVENINLDPDPQIFQTLDPDSDPLVMYADPKLWQKERKTV